jgi:hypothetical protein
VSDKLKDNRGRGGAIAFGAGGLLLVLAFYVLSVGPMDALATNGIISAPLNGVVFWFYAPLRWVSAHCQPFSDLMTAYSEWCYRLSQ